MSAVDKFPILLSEAEEESSAVPPCFSDEGINVRRQGPYMRGAGFDKSNSISTFDTTTYTSWPSRNETVMLWRFYSSYTRLSKSLQNTSKSSRKRVYEITLWSYTNYWTR